MLWAVVMAGGWGTRLWPLSRRKTPKPFLKLLPGRDSLLEETVKRLTPLIPNRRILVIGNQEHLAGLKKHAPKIPRSQIIGEPVSRNTGATVALGASLISRRDPNATALFLPADHWIGDKTKFHQAVKTAARISNQSKRFSIFGVKPIFPSSSYGYIKVGKKVSGSVYPLKQFVEKPSVKRAKQFLSTGQFFWHAGIFLAPAKTVLDSVRQFMPAFFLRILSLSVRKGKVVPQKLFHALPSISFDYAVLEKLGNAYLIRGDFDLCDVGTWKSFEDLWPKDGFQNSAMGSYLAFDSRGNIVYSRNKLVCLQGIHDLVVIDTPDALLVSRKDLAEEVRKVVMNLSKKKLAKFS